MSSAIEQAIRQICDEKGLAFESVIDAIQSALGAAYRKDFGDKNQNIEVEFDPETGKIEYFNNEKRNGDNLLSGSFQIIWDLKGSGRYRIAYLDYDKKLSLRAVVNLIRTYREYNNQYGFDEESSDSFGKDLTVKLVDWARRIK